MELSKVLEARLKTLQEAYGKQQGRVLSLEKALTSEKSNLDVIVGQIQECEIYLKEFGKKEELPIEEVKNGTEPISE
jgi:CII-binding regulator of phage lambda lysogenization HflD